MKKASLSFILAFSLVISATRVHAEGYNKFEIKYGMHEKTVNAKYGQPVLIKKIQINPIPRKKALYKINESDYMILYFFSGRIKEITLLQDMGHEEAVSVFKEKQIN